MGLQQFEQRLERLVEGAFAKAFRGELQPVELGRRLTREMDLRRAVAARGIIAPNNFEVVLAKDDFEHFSGFVEVLAHELVEAAREHAHTEGYVFLGPVEVVITTDDELPRSTFVINASVAENEASVAGWLLTNDGRKFEISDEVVTIGRLAECGIQLDDGNVSRRHAQLRRDGDSLYVVDLGSMNGTTVNGSRVRSHRLSHGDVIRIGSTALRFEAS